MKKPEFFGFFITIFQEKKMNKELFSRLFEEKNGNFFGFLKEILMNLSREYRQKTISFVISLILEEKIDLKKHSFFLSFLLFLKGNLRKQ